jgi:Leucine-rich repeat (LRR) protein
LVGAGIIEDIVINCSRTPDDISYYSGIWLNKVPAPLPVGLTQLDLNENKITVIQRHDFHACYHLHFLNLRLNSLKRIESNAFEDLGKLQALHLNLNDLPLYQRLKPSGFPIGILDPLTSITDLRLHCNCLNGLRSYRKDVLRNKSLLQTLSLDGVPHAKLPKPQGNIQLQNLTKISIFTGIAILRDQFVNWYDVPIETLAIYSADCKGERLSVIHPDVFKNLPRLKTLDLSWNPNLDFSRNLTDGLKGLNVTQIERLMLRNIYPGRDNTISLQKELFQSLTNLSLKELYLDTNGISNIDPGFDIADYLPDLKVLSLSYNRVFGNFVNVLNRTANLTHLEYLNMNSQTRRDPYMPMLTGRRNPYYIVIQFPQMLTNILLQDAVDYMFPILKNVTVIGGARNITLIDLSCNLFRELLGPVEFLGNYSSRHIGTLNLSKCGIAGIGELNGRY